jgi:hypothetical protein
MHLRVGEYQNLPTPKTRSVSLEVDKATQYRFESRIIRADSFESYLDRLTRTEIQKK